MNSSFGCLEGQRVLVKTDNQNVTRMLKVGSRVPLLQNIVLRVLDACKSRKVSLDLERIPRKSNIEADLLSRCSDSDDWSVRDFIFNFLDAKWGPHSCDMFACDYNTKCFKFYSKHWCPGTAGIDAFNYKWANDICWLVPPPRLVSQCIYKIKQEKCRGSLIVPMWKSAPYWPLLFPDGEIKASFVHEFIVYPPDKLTKRGRGRNGIFDGRPLKFPFLAIRLI